MLQAIVVGLIIAGAIALLPRRPPDPVQDFIEEQRDRMRNGMREV